MYIIITPWDTTKQLFNLRSLKQQTNFFNHNNKGDVTRDDFEDWELTEEEKIDFGIAKVIKGATPHWNEQFRQQTQYLVSQWCLLVTASTQIN